MKSSSGGPDRSVISFPTLQLTPGTALDSNVFQIDDIILQKTTLPPIPWGLRLVFAPRVQQTIDIHVYSVYHSRMNSREVIARLKKEGWFLFHTRGSHQQFKHPDEPGKVTVPHPKKDLPKGTLHNIFGKWVGNGRRGDSLCATR
jgi:predicted RNA binding protein YcfA (HicA-like mRNA interferase family)